MMMLSSIFVLLTQKLKNNSSFKVKNVEHGEAESTVILLNIHHHQQFQDIKMLLMVSVHQVTNHQLLLFTITHLIRQSHHRKSSKPLDLIGSILIQRSEAQAQAQAQAVSNKTAGNTGRWPMQGGLQSISNTSTIKTQSNTVPVTVKVEAITSTRDESQTKTPSPKKESSAPGKENIPVPTSQLVE